MNEPFRYEPQPHVSGLALPDGMRFAAERQRPEINPRLPTLFVHEHDTGTSVTVLRSGVPKTVVFSAADHERSIAGVYLQHANEVLIEKDFTDREPDLLSVRLPNMLVRTRRKLKTQLGLDAKPDDPNAEPLFEERRGGLSRLNANVVFVEKTEEQAVGESFDALPPLIIDPDTNELSIPGDSFGLNTLSRPTRAMLELLHANRHHEVDVSQLGEAMKAAGSITGYVGPALYQGVIIPMREHGHPVDEYFVIRAGRNIEGVTLHGKLEIDLPEGVDPVFPTKMYRDEDAFGKQGPGREIIDGSLVTSHLVGAIEIADKLRPPAKPVESTGTAGTMPVLESFDPKRETTTPGGISEEQAPSAEFDPNLPTLIVQQEKDKTVVRTFKNGRWNKIEYTTDAVNGTLLNYVLQHPNETLTKADLLGAIPDEKRPDKYNTTIFRQRVEDGLGMEPNELFSVENKGRYSTFSLAARVIHIPEDADIEPALLAVSGITLQVGDNLAGELSADRPRSRRTTRRDRQDVADEAAYRDAKRKVSDSWGASSEPARFAPTGRETRAEEDVVEVTVVERAGTSRRHEWSEVEQRWVGALKDALIEGVDQAKTLEVLRDAVWNHRAGEEMNQDDIDTVIRFANRADYSLRKDGIDLRVKPSFDEEGKVSGYYLENPAAKTPDPEAPQQEGAPAQPTETSGLLTHYQISDAHEKYILDERARRAKFGRKIERDEFGPGIFDLEGPGKNLSEGSDTE